MSLTIAQRLLATLSATDISDKAARVYFESLLNRYCDLTDTPMPTEGQREANGRNRIAEIEAKYQDPNQSITMSDALLYERLAL